GEMGLDDDRAAASVANVGAEIMGRHMFGPPVLRGGWGEDPWRGWWGEDPPFHTPVFVLTHHERAPLETAGGTTRSLVIDGIESAPGRAVDAADGRDVALGGGAETVQQDLRAGLVDEMEIHVAPLLLGGGSRLFENLDGGPRGFELAGLVSSPAVAHYRYV